jgi:uncharacterized membrane protein YcaP (DUF421 family)
MLEQVPWAELFALSLPLAEIVVRGSAMYWFLFLLLRFVLRRNAASVGVADILLLVLLADAAQNAMAGDYRSISDGMVLVSVLLGWNYLLDWLAYRFEAVARFVDPPPLILVRNGQMVRRNMRAEHITEDELESKLREQGIDSISTVKAMYLEPDGGFSVITRA